MTPDYLLAVAGLVNMGQRSNLTPHDPPSEQLEQYHQPYQAPSSANTRVMTHPHMKRELSPGTSSAIFFTRSQSMPPPKSISSDSVSHGGIKRHKSAHHQKRTAHRSGFGGAQEQFSLPLTRMSGPGDTLKPGLYGKKVGLISGLRTDLMDKYLAPEEGGHKSPRAPRQDLSRLSAEEKIERRRNQARDHSRRMREHRMHMQKELKKQIQEMRLFKAIMEYAPHVVAIVSPNAYSIILYGNAALSEVMARPLVSLQGSPFLDLLHPADRSALAVLLQTTVLQAHAPQKATLRCRLLCGDRQAGDYPYQAFDISVAYGTSGVICSGWRI